MTAVKGGGGVEHFNHKITQITTRNTHFTDVITFSGQQSTHTANTCRNLTEQPNQEMQPKILPEPNLPEMAGAKI